MSKIYKSPSIHQTSLYRAKAAYANMKIRCGNSDGNNPSYANVELRMSIEEWLEWAVPQYQLFMLNNPGVTPVAARPKDQGHYEIGNIKIISMRENLMEMKRSITEHGTKVCTRCKLEKDLPNFSRRTNGHILSQCKSCRVQITKEYKKSKRAQSSSGRTADF